MQLEKRLKWLRGISGYVFKRFYADHCNTIASDLTLTSILALAPLMTVVVSLLSIFPALKNIEAKLQDLIFQSFVPTAGEVIQTHLQEFVTNSKQLTFTTFGFVFLFVTAFLLLRAIDKGFNVIWHSESKRSRVNRLLVYWSLITLAPILMASSLVFTNSLGSIPFIKEAMEQVSGFTKFFLPLMLETTAFTLLYLIVPNHRIKFRYAFISALIAALAFELAKFGFAQFVGKFSTYDLVYGALATVPVFILWVYLSWTIVLFGAQICHALHRYQMRDSAEVNEFVQSAQLCGALAKGQQQQQSVPLAELRAQFPNYHEDVIRERLAHLQKIKVAGRLADGSYCLRVNGEKYTLAELYQASEWQMPNEADLVAMEEGPDDELQKKLDSANSALIDALGHPLV